MIKDKEDRPSPTFRRPWWRVRRKITTCFPTTRRWARPIGLIRLSPCRHYYCVSRTRIQSDPDQPRLPSSLGKEPNHKGSLRNPAASPPARPLKGRIPPCRPGRGGQREPGRAQQADGGGGACVGASADMVPPPGAEPPSLPRAEKVKPGHSPTRRKGTVPGRHRPPRRGPYSWSSWSGGSPGRRRRCQPWRRRRRRRRRQRLWAEGATTARARERGGGAERAGRRSVTKQTGNDGGRRMRTAGWTVAGAEREFRSSSGREAERGCLGRRVGSARFSERKWQLPTCGAGIEGWGRAE